jgi:segregation and condensation protein B
MTPEQIVEATLFASQSPLTPAELAQADESLDAARVEDALQTLRETYDGEGHAFQLYQLGDGYQLLTRPEYAPYLERFDSVSRPPALSRAALETLAIIA